MVFGVRNAGVSTSTDHGLTIDTKNVSEGGLTDNIVAIDTIDNIVSVVGGSSRFISKDNGETFHEFTAADGIYATSTVYGGKLDSNGNLYTISYLGLDIVNVNYDNFSESTVETVNKAIIGSPKQIAIDSLNNIYIATFTGLWLKQAGSSDFTQLYDTQRCWGVVALSNNKVIAGCIDEIVTISNPGSPPSIQSSSSIGVESTTIYKLFTDSFDRVFLTYNGNATLSVSEDEGLSFESVNVCGLTTDLFEDQEGYLWLTTSNGIFTNYPYD